MNQRVQAHHTRRPASALPWAIASAGLTAFALFTQLLAAGGHAPGVDAAAEHGEPAAVPLLLASAAILGLWRVAPEGLRTVRQGRPDGHIAVTVLVVVLAGLGQWLAAAICSSLAAAWIAGRRR